MGCTKNGPEAKSRGSRKDRFYGICECARNWLEPEFVPFLIVNDSGGPNRTYDDLVNKLRGTKNLEFEAVVGDVTIRANREREVDFSLPYTESGVVMVNLGAPCKPSAPTWHALFVSVGGSSISRKEHGGKQLGEICVGGMVVHGIRYQQGSFVKDFLTNWLNMDITQCQSYLNMEAYDKALSLGCKNGGVDAIFDEIPYIRLFLHKYGSKYKTVGTTYNTGGFGFAFPIGSPLSKAISKAILDLRELGTMRKIEKKYFDAGNTSYYDAEDVSQEPSFTANSFAGLFIITAFLTLLALVCSECSFALSKYRVHSIEMTHDVSPQNDLHDQQKEEDDEISSEEVRKEQDLLQEITDVNTDRE
ncbi:hypothetical protein AgCh_006500 [Apium graveolens]